MVFDGRRALQERQGLSETSQALLLKYLTESTPGPKRLKGLLPAGTIVAHKTGTQGGITAATNDIGIATLPNGRRLAIAVFVADSPADEATREGVIAKVGPGRLGEIRHNYLHSSIGLFLHLPLNHPQRGSTILRIVQQTFLAS